MRTFILTYQTENHSNENARIKYVESKIAETLKSRPGTNFLDLGAGLSPFRPFIETNGGRYFSQDFSSYIPNAEEFGLQNKDWNYPSHDYVCDIADFEPGYLFDNLICTEVLEHVADPIAVLQKISQIVMPDARVIITVPMLSLVHQAPHFYSAGLSTFWFKKWAPTFGLQINEIVISGNFADLLDQEILRGLSQLPRFYRNRFFLAIKDLFTRSVRKYADPGVLQSGGYAIFVFATKLDSSFNSE
jgi:2-polyprenyl-3-methyl-5-hydroxy-6-metoxy-1,4-benzoquinol methylase